MTKGSMVGTKGHKRSILYMTTNYEDTIVVAENAKKTGMWYFRLGHLSEKCMKLMVTNGEFIDLKIVNHYMCESCIFGKQERVSFLSDDRKLKSQ